MSKKPSSNPTEPPFVPITLDKPRRLVFDWNALITLGDATGENMLSEGAWDRLLGWNRDEKGKVTQANPNPKNLRAMLWAGMLADDPEITLERVGALVHPGNMGRVLAALLGAVYAQDDVAEGSGAKRPTVAAESGETS